MQKVEEKIGAENFCSDGESDGKKKAIVSSEKRQ